MNYIDIKISEKYSICKYPDHLHIYFKKYRNCNPTDSISGSEYYMNTCKEAGIKEGKKVAKSFTIYYDKIKTYEDFYNIVVLNNKNQWYFEEDMLKIIQYCLDYECLI